MNNIKRLLLPSFTPLVWVYLAGLIYVTFALVSFWLITQSPSLGVSFISVENGRGIAISATHSKAAQEKLRIGDIIIAVSATGYSKQVLGDLSIMEEPDNFATYHKYNQFIEHQRQLFKIFSQPVVSLSLSGGETLQIKPQKTRAINHLPYQYWILLIIAGIGFYIGLWIWIFRRGQIESRLLAISAFGFMLGACCLTVYSNRELVINPLQFKLLASLNHLGNITFAYSALILLCYYPGKIANRSFALIGFFAILLVWLNETLQYIEIPIHTFYFLPYIAPSVLATLVGRQQWLKHKYNPVARASIRWFLLTLSLCIGSALILYFIPTIFNEPPLLPLWMAQFIILGFYIGLVLGIIQYQLFDVEQWWFNCWIWFFSGCCILAADLSLMYLFNSNPLQSISLAILIIAWCYFPFRQWLWCKNVHPRNSRVDSFFPLLTESYISSLSIKQFEDSWPDILSKIYQPLSIKSHAKPIDSVSLRDHGLNIVLPSLNKQQHLIISGMERGAKLFGKSDVHFIESALAYARNCINQKQVREDEAKLERERITRDLHDDVGALLLTLIHKAESEENTLLARNALKGVRDSIYSLRDDNFTTFNAALSSWREEIKQRTDAAQIKLLWNIGELPDNYLLTPRQHINLERILRESITNILKHAYSQSINISIKENNGNLQIIIVDDGISSDPSQWQENTGLCNLHTRAKEIRADIMWSSRDASLAMSKGTKFTITLPRREK